MTDRQGHILVVDDNLMNRIKLSRGLEQQGYSIGVAENGRLALEMLRAQDFDVVLLDIIMPEMDGFEVLSSMKGDTRLRAIPVIVISALDEMDSVVRCIEMGAVDYLPKPFNPVLLRARLETSLQKKKLRDLERSYLQQEVMLRQSEKLATLGRLSAGMAHELNNPAAAAQRGAEQLGTAVAQLQEAHLALYQFDLSAEQLTLLLQLEQTVQQRADKPPQLDSLVRSDHEDAVEAWLAEQSIAGSWEFAPILVSLGYSSGDLSQLGEKFAPAQMAPVIAWLSATFTICNLLAEIREGSRRISTIVKALKAYSYLDQAPMQAVDVHEALDNTLVMLQSKLKEGVTVQRQYNPDLPRIQAYGSELNQVWTNLIDNAIAAMNGRGEITLRTRQEGERVVVQIADNGPGIPADIQDKIFDPFFTTKPPGEGTGLGLNISHNIIVQKHKGEIVVVSQPGRTCFAVNLPIHPETGEF